MTLDWDNDPELRKMRDDFVASFAERRSHLTGPLAKLAGVTDPGARKTVLFESRMAAHKVAGAAESYGFPTVTEAAGALDDVLSLSKGVGPEADGFIQLVDEMLEHVQKNGKDPAHLRADSRFAALTSAAGSLVSEATS